MVEPGRSAGVREAKKSSTTSSSTAAAAMVKKKLTTTKKRPEKEEKAEKKQSRQCTEPESPSYRLALKSLFSCRNSHGHGQHHARPRAQQDTGSRSKRLGCSAPSICKLRDDSESRHQRMPVPPPEDTMGGTTAGEPCKRRASVSGSSERCVKKPLSESKCGTGRSSSATAASSSSNSKQLQRGGSSLSSSSSSGGSSFRAGMQLRRLSGCYECHMVVDPVSGSTSMRATASTICPCPDCGEVFVRQESLHLHQSIRHAGWYWSTTKLIIYGVAIYFRCI